MLPEDTLIGKAAKVMRDKDVSSVLVTSNNNNSNEPIGIVTEKDNNPNVRCRKYSKL